MARIAERAGMFQSNIHYYYKSKHELMMAVHKKVLDRCAELQEELLSAACGSDLKERIGVFWGQKREFIVNEQKYDFAEIDFWVQSRVDAQVKKVLQNHSLYGVLKLRKCSKNFMFQTSGLRCWQR